MDEKVLRKLKQLKIEVEGLEEKLKVKKKEFDTAEETAFNEMIESQMMSANFDGTMFSVSTLARPSIKGEEHAKERFYRYLAQHGFGSLIVTRREVPSATLGKWFREYTNDAPKLRKSLERYLKIFDDQRVLMRGGFTPAAAPAGTSAEAVKPGDGREISTEEG